VSKRNSAGRPVGSTRSPILQRSSASGDEPGAVVADPESSRARPPNRSPRTHVPPRRHSAARLDPTSGRAAEDQGQEHRPPETPVVLFQHPDRSSIDGDRYTRSWSTAICPSAHLPAQPGSPLLRLLRHHLVACLTPSRHTARRSLMPNPVVLSAGMGSVQSRSLPAGHRRHAGRAELVVAEIAEDVVTSPSLDGRAPIHVATDHGAPSE
jgi:hypothetical protein